MFEFARPRPRSLPEGHGRQDFGYSMFGIHVNDMDVALERIARVGGVPLTAPTGEIGERRICLRDPDGVLLELMEDSVISDEGTAAGAAHGGPSIEFVSISVRSIDQVRKFWIDILGLDELRDRQVHRRCHERLWGLDGASREALVLRGGDVALEFVKYTKPQCRWRPAGYLISDLGVLNIALGCTDRETFDATYERAAAHGFTGYREPLSIPNVATVVYLRDPQGLSVELLHVELGALERMGFVASESGAGRI
jgi:catechol 2,3-dioxygenase-like lactoylglutathione lyase family enzyme